MYIPFYFIEDSWCILEIYIKNNCYWIDWNVIYDNNNIEIKDKNKISLDYTNNSYILCVRDNRYCYYNTDDKIIYDLYDHYNLFSIDGSQSLNTLNNLKNEYDEFIYNIPEKV
jgi:hypothetical protein